jgi:hypothetical protein
MSERGIRFVYEEPIRLRDRAGREVVLRPDFVIHLASGEIIIWEHLGMLDDDRYRETLDFKLKAYHEAGYIMGKNLFFTADDVKGRLDMEVISNLLDEICKKGGGRME